VFGFFLLNKIINNKNMKMKKNPQMSKRLEGYLDSQRNKAERHRENPKGNKEIWESREMS